jgi:hypothetical protein
VFTGIGPAPTNAAGIALVSVTANSNAGRFQVNTR